MNWLDELWAWAGHLVARGEATSQIGLGILLLLGVVLLGSWLQSRIAQ